MTKLSKHSSPQHVLFRIIRIIRIIIRILFRIIRIRRSQKYTHTSAHGQTHTHERNL